MFQRHLKRFEGHPGVFTQAGNTMVIVETRQWKLSHSPSERAKFDLSGDGGQFIEVTGDDNDVHLIP